MTVLTFRDVSKAPVKLIKRVKIAHSFLTHGSSGGRKVSHCYWSRCCYGEPTCTAHVFQFDVAVVVQKPRSQQWSSGNESGHCGGSGRLRTSGPIWITYICQCWSLLFWGFCLGQFIPEVTGCNYFTWRMPGLLCSKSQHEEAIIQWIYDCWAWDRSQALQQDFWHVSSLWVFHALEFLKQATE